MPAIETIDLRQRAVLWPCIGLTPAGRFNLGTPVEVACRWNTKRREVTDSFGELIVLDALAVVIKYFGGGTITGDILIGSRMWLAPDGTLPGRALDAWYGTGSAGVPNEVHEVRTVNDTSDLKVRNRRRELGLARAADSVAE